MQPRPYQLEAARRVRQVWADKGPAGIPLVCLPTGAGKSVTAGLALHGAALPATISHTTTLRDQLERALPGVRSLTIQGLVDAGPERARAALAGVDRVVIDEAHHYVADSPWGRAIAAALPPGALQVRLTATPERLDGAGLGGPGGCTDLIAPTSYSALVRDGHLVPCTVQPCPDLAGNPAQAYLSHARSSVQRCGGVAVVAPHWRPGILFTPTKAGAARAVVALRAAGVRATTVDADTPTTVRRQAFAAFDRGELDVLASPMALSEGFDSPRAEVCVLDRACHGVGLYLQCAGRVLRPHPGKESALLLDCRGASERHGAPTEDRVYSLEGIGIRRVPRTTVASRPAGARGAAARTTVASTAVRRTSPGGSPRVAVGRAAVAGRLLGRALGAVWSWVTRVA